MRRRRSSRSGPSRTSVPNRPPGRSADRRSRHRAPGCAARCSGGTRRGWWATSRGPLRPGNRSPRARAPRDPPRRPPGSATQLGLAGLGPTASRSATRWGRRGCRRLVGRADAGATVGDASMVHPHSTAAATRQLRSRSPIAFDPSTPCRQSVAWSLLCPQAAEAQPAIGRLGDELPRELGIAREPPIDDSARPPARPCATRTSSASRGAGNSSWTAGAVTCRHQASFSSPSAGPPAAD